MGSLFGTDGVRGVANSELTPELAFRLGRGGAYVLAEQFCPADDRQRPRMLICRDTRVSGAMLEAALIAGITSVGVDVVTAGVLPTPACAFLVREWDMDAGIMISASHNPAPDNGIKFFSRTGCKLSDAMEERIEELVHCQASEKETLPRPTGNGVGQWQQRLDGAHRYTAFLQEAVPVDLHGLRIVVDCANGAASPIVPSLFRNLGAELVVLHADPDGNNINEDCGSTHMESIIHSVKEQEQPTLGIAYDGDADRVLLVDEQGNLVDGDHILAICAQHYQDSGGLAGGKVAATHYSNGGLRNSLQSLGLDLEMTAAGDRYVLEAMQVQNLILGGEQSGHIIFLEHNTTGDGILSSLKILKIMIETGQTLSVLRQVMTTFPQVLLNVPVLTKEGWQHNSMIREAMQRAQKVLAPDGRLLVRPSGTEPLLRVMTEHAQAVIASAQAELVAAAIRSELG